MNRKIIFRGYNLKNKKWLYGYYLVNRGKHFIAEEGLQQPGMTWEDFEVDPYSVGQYVGEYKGEPIYEGDFVEVVESDGYRSKHFGAVVYDDIDCRFYSLSESNAIPITGKKQYSQTGMGGYYDFYYMYKVIGNEYEEKLKISNP